ncbi:MAG TPA: HAD family hydrolase [Bacillales bacterium]|nr:HAD family hydrolase [Bacillales bacterium]
MGTLFRESHVLIRSEKEWGDHRLVERKRRHFKAVIFQLEEIVAHTTPFEIEAWIDCARQLGIANEDLEDRISRWDSVKLARWMVETGEARGMTSEDLIEQKERIFLASLGRLTPRDVSPGIAPLLKNLKKNGIRLSAASARVNVSEAIEQLEVGDFFNDVEDGGGEAGLLNRVEAACERLGADVQECIVIIDADEAPLDGRESEWLVIAVGCKDPVEGAVWTIENTGELTYEALKEMYEEAAH